MFTVSVKIDERIYQVEIDQPPGDGNLCYVRVNGESVHVCLPTSAETPDQVDWILIEDKPYELLFDQHLHWIREGDQIHPIELHQVQNEKFQPQYRDGKVKAPIPGQINQVLVEPGMSINTGQTVVILEAMKMFNELKAPRCGVVQAVHVQVGDNVKRGEVLVEVGSENQVR